MSDQNSGAIGRLSDAERGAIGWAVERDWQLRDQRDDWDGLYAVVERIIREHTERAWDEGKWAAYYAERDDRDGSEVPNPYRAARQEQS